MFCNERVAAKRVKALRLMKKAASTLAVLIAATVAVFVQSRSFAQELYPPPPLALKAPAPDWSLRDLTGKEVKLSDFRGKVVVLNFWATWCTPCRMEIPDFIKFHTDYEKQGVVVVGISIDEGGARAVKPFAKAAKINYPILLGTEQVVRKYKIEPIPATFIIDQKGKLVSSHVGLMHYGEVKDAVAPLLK